MCEKIESLDSLVSRAKELFEKVRILYAICQTEHNLLKRFD